jgi:hypothetical protein
MNELSMIIIKLEDANELYQKTILGEGSNELQSKIKLFLLNESR